MNLGNLREGGGPLGRGQGWSFRTKGLQCLLVCGSFRKLGVPYFGGVLIIRILLFRVLY